MRDFDSWEISVADNKQKNPDDISSPKARDVSNKQEAPDAVNKPKTSNRVGGAFITLLLIVVLAVIVVLATLFVYRLRHPQDDTAAGYKPLRVTTDSMEPTIMTGAIVIARQVPFDSLKPGDIITFVRGDGMLNTHRIISIENGAAVTQGDNALAPDIGAVTAYNFRYKIIFVMNWVARMNTFSGAVKVLAIPAVIILAIVILCVFLTKRRRKV